MASFRESRLTSFNTKSDIALVQTLRFGNGAQNSGQGAHSQRAMLRHCYAVMEGCAVSRMT